MRCVAIDGFGPPEALLQTDLPRPRPTRGELLVRVVAAGVSALDCRIRAGHLAEQIDHDFPLIPGFSAAGVIEELGEDIGRFRKGDRVWVLARPPRMQWGCYAEFVTAPEAGVGLMPSKLLFEEAAPVPHAALSALQALSWRRGDGAVLVTGAAGDVGHIAVQLARNAGAQVLATADTEDHAFVLGLGATATIDPARDEPGEVTRRHIPEGVDLVIDTVGGDVATSSCSALAEGGRLISLTEPLAAAAAKRNLHTHFLLPDPDTEQLALIAQQVDQNRLRAHVHRIHALADAPEAHAAIESARTQGASVLNL
jgi:NADPH:quinone reductase-like Zn-dependent oxidoreductase